MEMSARNQLRGTVKAIKQGGVMAEVLVELPDGQQITSVITVDAVQSLHLHEGDQVTAVIKSTEVMIGKNV
ncbi:MAG: TOBE domain-containing protein [Ktedonobacteraceae bacterium]|nr:TOBE domain-containing protein [Ktedonobacteraceae bacterium]